MWVAKLIVFYSALWVANNQTLRTTVLENAFEMWKGQTREREQRELNFKLNCANRAQMHWRRQRGRHLLIIVCLEIREQIFFLLCQEKMKTNCLWKKKREEGGRPFYLFSFQTTLCGLPSPSPSFLLRRVKKEQRFKEIHWFSEVKARFFNDLLRLKTFWKQYL